MALALSLRVSLVGSSSLSGGLTPAAPEITGSPTISGTPTVGSTLTLTPAPVTGYPSPGRTWERSRDGGAFVEVVGLGEPGEYVVLAADHGAALTFRQKEANTEGTATADAAATAAVTYPAPTLSSFTAAADGGTAYTGSITTDQAAGSIFVAAVPTSASAPSKADVENGTGDAVGLDSVAPPSAGANALAGSGLAPDTEYELWAFHRNGDGVETALVTSASFTTAAAPVAVGTPTLTVRTGPVVTVSPSLTASPFTMEAGRAEWIASPPGAAAPSLTATLKRESAPGTDVYDVTLDTQTLSDPDDLVAYTVDPADDGLDAVLEVAWTDDSGTTTVTSAAVTLSAASGPEAVATPTTSLRTGPVVTVQPTLAAPSGSPSDPLTMDAGRAEWIGNPPGTTPGLTVTLRRESVAASGVYDVVLTQQVLTDPADLTGYVVQAADANLDAVMDVEWEDESGTTTVTTDPLSLTLSPDAYLSSPLPTLAIEQSVGQADTDLSAHVISATAATYALAAGAQAVPAGVSITSGGVLQCSGTAASEGEHNIQLAVTNSSSTQYFPLKLVVQDTASTGTAITFRSITYTFSEAVTYGSYWNGEIWVLVHPTATWTTSTSPGEETTSATWKQSGRASRVIHGAVIGWPSRSETGWDDTFRSPNNSPNNDHLYNDALNVDPDYTGTPIALDEAKTIVKALSSTEAQIQAEAAVDYRPHLEELHFITVTPRIPLENSFRPSAEAADDKIARYTTADVNLALLPAETLPTGVDAPAWTTRLSHQKWPHVNYSGRYERMRGSGARSQQIDVYGREYAYESGYALMALLLDYPTATKQELAWALVQQGLDLSALYVGAGQTNLTAAGNSLGRKLPMAVAAWLLDDASMQPSAGPEDPSGDPPIMSEDGEFFRVSAWDVSASIWHDGLHSLMMQFSDDQIGFTEFGQQYYAANGSRSTPEQAGINWELAYRAICSNCLVPAYIALKTVPALRAIWKNDLFLEYIDQWVGVEYERGGTSTGPTYSDGFRKGYDGAFIDQWGLLTEDIRPRMLGGTTRPLSEYEVYKPQTLEGISDGFRVTIWQNRQVRYPEDLRNHADARYDLRYRAVDAGTWTTVTGFRDGTNWETAYDVTGLGSGNEFEVQTRLVITSHAAGRTDGPWGTYSEWWNLNNHASPPAGSRLSNNNERDYAYFDTVTTL